MGHSCPLSTIVDRHHKVSIDCTNAEIKEGQGERNNATGSQKRVCWQSIDSGAEARVPQLQVNFSSILSILHLPQAHFNIPPVHTCHHPELHATPSNAVQRRRFTRVVVRSVTDLVDCKAA
jgi:hypothetical protein